MTIFKALQKSRPSRTKLFSPTEFVLGRMKMFGPALILSFFSLAGLAQAETAAPGWEITSHSNPTDIAPGGSGLIYLDVFNVGAANTEAGKQITVTDVLPEGVTALYAGEIFRRKAVWDCTGVGTSVVRCTNDPVNLPTFPGGGTPLGAGLPDPSLTPLLYIEVAVTGAPRTVVNQATVAGGGGVDAASTTSPVDIGSTPAKFGVANWDVWFSKANGTLDTQAGSHPYTATFDLEVNSEPNEEYRRKVKSGEPLSPAAVFSPAGGELRNATVDLPPGFVGNPTAVPQCPRNVFDESGQEEPPKCSPSTEVGFASPVDNSFSPYPIPIFNIVPPPGVAAEFAFNELGNPVFLDSSVRTGGDSGIVTHANNNPQGRGVRGAVITLWGVPGDPSHNSSRCDYETVVRECSSGAGTAPLLTLPTACQQPGEPAPQVTVHVNSWQNPNLTAEKTVALHDSSGVEPGDEVGFTGCEALSFGSLGPSLSAAPDTRDADTPAGLTVEVKPQLGGLTEAGGLSTSDIQDTTVTLPQGFVINPGQAAGLQACQVGDEEGGDDLPLPGENGEEERFAGPAKCPNASKVGTVVINTPLIEGGAEKQLEGNVYVLQSNPPEIKLLVTASADGVNVKLVGTVHLSEQTGQLTTTFSGTPELPFSDFKLSFSGGAQAALDTPTQCGSYTTTSDFTPWSSPFVSDVFPSSSFNVEAGPGGSPCSSDPLPFSPSLTAGATTDQAGGYTDFSLLLQRDDGQQRIDGLQFKAPEGLTGFLSKVPLCTNAQAEANACPAASKIGHTVVESGPGPYPLVVPEPGQEPAPIYLTESYDGAPFGLAIVVPLHVGPFTLPTQRVRARIEVNPLTSALTITTNPLPQEVAGVPTDLREIDAVIERPEFMVNPTNCNPSEFSGTAYGTAPPGQSEPNETAPISSHFQVGACKSLEFAPKISVSTSGKTSKSDGASLTYKVSYPNVPQGTQSDIRYVKVELPGELPSRLTTLQKACTAKVFDENPASCPAPSVIGHALVHTPLLPVPLEGPVYFVSNGGEAFPNLEMVLQGDGVTVDLIGDTLIKNGVTSTTFKAVPDDPFNTFEINLPEGPYSALAANGNLCGQKLTMPTELVAQNGAEIKQNTQIAVTGCPNSISISSHKVKGKTTTIQVSVPAAGKLTATGKGLSKASKTASGRETVSLVLNQKKGGKLKTNIKLTFTPSKGAKQTKTVTVRFKK